MAEAEPFNAAALNAYGLAAEARGDLPAACAAFGRAAALFAGPRGTASAILHPPDPMLCLFSADYDHAEALARDRVLCSSL